MEHDDEAVQRLGGGGWKPVADMTAEELDSLVQAIAPALSGPQVVLPKLEMEECSAVQEVAGRVEQAEETRREAMEPLKGIEKELGIDTEFGAL